MVLVKDDQVPVSSMYPLVVGFDAAGLFVDAEKILERTKADDRPVFVRPLVALQEKRRFYRKVHIPVKTPFFIALLFRK